MQLVAYNNQLHVLTHFMTSVPVKDFSLVKVRHNPFRWMGKVQ
jgi:hypothetical protein